jgi:hypothetical protein
MLASMESVFMYRHTLLLGTYVYTYTHTHSHAHTRTKTHDDLGVQVHRSEPDGLAPQIPYVRALSIRTTSGTIKPVRSNSNGHSVGAHVKKNRLENQDFFAELICLENKSLETDFDFHLLHLE